MYKKMSRDIIVLLLKTKETILKAGGEKVHVYKRVAMHCSSKAMVTRNSGRTSFTC